MGTLKRLTRSIASIITSQRPRGFWAGFLLGVLYFSWIFSWIWSISPLSDFGITGRFASFALVGIGYWGSVLVMAGAWGIAGWLIIRGWHYSQSFVFPFYAAACFVLLEYARAWIYGFLWWGSGSIAGPHWTFGNLAYWFVDAAPVRILASMVGIYGVEFVIVSWISLGWFLSRRNLLRQFAIASSVLMIGLGISHVLLGSGLSEDGEGVPVQIIQTARPTITETNAAELLKDTTEKLRLVASLRDSIAPGTLVVFPEGANFASILKEFLDATSLSEYFQKIGGSGTVVIDNNRISEGTGTVSRVTALDVQDGLLGDSYDKELLTPWGEYLPFIVELPLKFLRPSLLQKYQVARGFEPGKGTNQIGTASGVLSILLCSDIISPNLARNKEHHVLVGMASNAIFKGNSWLQQQMLSIARFRAAEQRKPLILAANFGRSHIINSYGKISVSAASSGYQILTGLVVPNETVTWYTRAGDVPIILLSLALLCYTWKHSLQPREKSSFSSSS